MSLKWSVTQNGILLKMECHSKWMSLKMKFHLKMDVTQNEMSLKVECHSNGMSLKI